MLENNKLHYLEQLANLTFDYTYLLKVDSQDKIIPEIIIGSFENITGYSIDEIREKNFFLSIVYEDDLLSFIEFWGNIISGKSGTIITRILTKSNEIKWVKNYSKAIIDETSENITMILGAVQDITEQKLMEEVLKESERTHRTLIEGMGEGIILADNNDHILYVNRKITHLLQYQKKEIIGKAGYSILVDENDRNLIIGKNRLRESGISDNYEAVFVKKDGAKVHVMVSGTPYTNEKGQVIGSIGVINDITEHKKNLDKIKIQNEEINTLYQAGKLLFQQLDVTAIFNTVFEVVIKVVNCSELFVARFDKKDSMIRYIFMRSIQSEMPAEVSSIPAIPLAPEGYGIVSDVIRKKKAIILNNYQESLKKSKTKYTVKVAEKETVPADDDSELYKPKSALIVPIIFEDEVLGVIQLYSQDKDAYSGEQLVFMEALMQQASFAYHNALLYQQAQDEIKERKAAEEYLRTSLNEREVLLKEIYHRVKNNLQVVSSLLKMQSEKIDDPETKKYFLESKDRVSAISLIHEKLYRMRDLSRIDFTDYIYSLVNNFKGLHALNNTVEISVDAQKLFMPIDIAMPCGLILNELLTNALKHAFDDNSENPRVHISFSLTPNMKKYILSVKDNGNGFPEEVDYSNADTLGAKLINTLIGQIDGELKLEKGEGSERQGSEAQGSEARGSKGRGSKVIIEFPPSGYKERLR